MSRNVTVSASPPSTGTTRDIDLWMDTVNGIKEAGNSPGAVRNRSSTQFSSNQIGISTVSTVIAFQQGRQAWNVPSGLGNGSMIQYGIPILTASPASLTAFNLRRGITRAVATIYADSFQPANEDVGMQFVVGGGALSALTTRNNVNVPGVSGFGIWQNAAGWNWRMKMVNSASGVFAETILITTVPDATVPTEMEIRVYDATGTVPARVDLIIAGVVFLSRYWINPVNIVTPTLPVLSTATGSAIYPQIRNTSTGPAGYCCFADFSLIHGPNNEGTT